ncbi:conserved hypothetical protein [Talaromyces stipitatus ATCC 10500]|uniref:DUF7603 domain-containing protein n=1 Tax=Talaromyces stipitatus (strain ATCC 10500 / CBS 375.48 / QM 6759 / NRRL 1006) TaxID=441959 RepID=B8LW80_TALSN|nr:uncharacterized protein TSTA_074870 [Talaromyces stipitatus ATCC 10500]EED24108.1 conserved hypothetical protein [Talaromyces stipitatus ATCC 10500]
MSSMEEVITANHPPPIATGSGGFSSSFLRRQRKDTIASSSSLTSIATANQHDLSPPPTLSDTDPSARSIIASSSSPVRRKPLPSNASPVILSRLSQGSSVYSPIHSPPPTRILPPLLPQTPPSSRPNAIIPTGRQSIDPSLRQLETVDEVLPFVPRDLDRYPRGQSPLIPFPIDTSHSYKDFQQQQSDFYYDGIDENAYLPHGTPIHSRLSSEPIIPVLRSPPPSTNHKRSETMALQPPQNRPPPLHIDASLSAMPSSGDKQPKTPGNKITSFFGWKTTSSPGAESSSTEISDNGRSPLPSPLPQSASAPSFSTKATSSFPTSVSENNIHGFPLPPARLGSLSGPPSSGSNADLINKISELEAELREISSELAGSIRREMELEDLVERFQLESHNDANRRTSDYFSDSGTSGSIRTGTDGGKVEDIERIKRAAEQERAQLKVELSQKWQEERSKRAACESHVQILENQVQQFRAQRVDNSNLSSKTKELEVALEDTRRKLLEERQLKDNFEDLLTAMRVELEQLRNERDHFRDEIVPALQAGQKNRFQAIAEEDGVGRNRGSVVGLSRSNSLARMPKRSSMAGGGLSRSNSISGNNRPVESRESLADRVKDVEAQRDALHQALRSLLDRQAWQARENEKRIKILEMELTKAQDIGSPRKLGYEKEVRNLREEINLLRRRADEALEQKWQCEKGLSGLKMDLDRAEQETTSLRLLLQEHDISLPAGMDMASNEEGLANMQATSSALESAYQQLQEEMESAEANQSWSPEDMNRTEALAAQVRRQLETNNALRGRLAEAIAKGEREQKMSASRINEMQSRLRTLEDTLMDAQHHSEDEMAKHEEEIRALKESHSVQLMRAKMGIRTPVALSPNPAASPFSGARSPRLDVTTTGDGVPLSEAVSVAKLEVRVKELEKALRDADFEMEEVVQRMNKAQIEVAELQSDRDEALRQTRRLEAAIMAEREKVKQ